MTSNNPFLNNKPFAEVIESGLDHFTAQCWEWDHFPAFGNLIMVDQENTRTIIGCVTQVHTGSMDPMRYPFPYKKTEEELRAEQPQIFEFLKTTCTIQILGYMDLENNKGYNYLLPPTPAKIHAFVRYAPMNIYATFFSKPHYLNILFAFASNIPNLDELLLALLHNLAQRQLLAKEQLGDFCEAFSLLTGNDYRRLKLFLKRVEDL